MDIIQQGMARKAANDAKFDGLIMSLWGQGLDTYEIARYAHIPQHEVANRLAVLRDAGRS